MNKKWYVVISASVVVVGLAVLIIFADPGWRIELYDAGDGSMDQEIVSWGPVSFRLGSDGKPKFDSVWTKSGTEFLVKDNLTVRDTAYRPGDRLIVDKNGRLVDEGYFKSLINDIVYYAWKLKKRNAYKSKTVYIRAEETELRLSPTENARELRLRFGAEVKAIGESGDWIKVVSENPKMRGWIHRYVTTESKDQIDMLRQEKRIPKLILLFNVNEQGDFQGTTLAGYYYLEYADDGRTKTILSPNDCLVFDKTGIDKIPRPFTLAGGYTIQEPRADKIYMLDTTGNFVLYDVIDFK